VRGGDEVADREAKRNRHTAGREKPDRKGSHNSLAQESLLRLMVRFMVNLKRMFRSLSDANLCRIVSHAVHAAKSGAVHKSA
jgi:hypothetical protein